MNRGLRRCTLVQRLGAANPGTISGGSFSATDAKMPHHALEVFSGARDSIYAWSTLIISRTLRTTQLQENIDDYPGWNSDNAQQI